MVVTRSTSKQSQLRKKTTNAIKIFVRPWLLKRIESLVTDRPRYESSIYGPANSWLSRFFNSHRGFILKPQPKLRPSIWRFDTGESDVESDIEGGQTDPEADADSGNHDVDRVPAATPLLGSDAEPLLDTSFDSANDPVLGRIVGGREKGVRIPDFTATRSNASRTDDELVLVVEIKTANVAVDSAKQQILEYLAVAERKNPAKLTLGMLIMGPDTYLWTLDGKTKEVKKVQAGRRFDTAGPAVTRWLTRVVENNIPSTRRTGRQTKKYAVSPWLLKRIKSLGKESPRYEASFYGPTNSWLNCFFDSDDGFLIKPQPKLRPSIWRFDTGESDIGSDFEGQGTNQEADPDAGADADAYADAYADTDSDSDADADIYSGDHDVSQVPAAEPPLGSDSEPLLDISLDSANDPVLGRIVGGREKGILIPDFTVTRSSASRTDDKLVLLVEIKARNLNVEVDSAKQQILEYLTAAERKNPAKLTVGMLIMGRDTYLWTLDGDTGEIKKVNGGHRFATAGSSVTTWLTDLAKSNRHRED